MASNGSTGGTRGVSYHSASISQLEQTSGWTAESWQVKLLERVDAAGIGASRGNGKITAREVDAYLRAPTKLDYLTSTAMEEVRRDLRANAELSGGFAADGFDHAWEDRVGAAADAAGNGDGTLTRAELDGYLDLCKQAEAQGPLWVADQKVAMLESEIEDVTGGDDPLRADGTRVGTELFHDYERIVMDDQKNVAQWSSYELSAADIAETPADVDRNKSWWKSDPELPYQGVTDSDYQNIGFDRGHLKPAEDSPDQPAMDDSHFMTNVAPQYANFNRQTWRTLEQGINELVQATGGKAQIITGDLYLGQDGKPLPPDQIQYTGAGDRKIAVPTHCFKAVRLTQADGTVVEFGFLVPNDADSPVTKDEIGTLLRGSKVSIDSLEGLVGQDFFGDHAADAPMEANADPTITFANAGGYHAASLIWPQPGVPLDTPVMPPATWRDGLPDWYRGELAAYGML